MEVINWISKNPLLPDGFVPEGAGFGDGSPTSSTAHAATSSSAR